MQVSSTTHNLTLSPSFCTFNIHTSNSSNRETIAVVPVRRRAALRMRAVAECGSCGAELVEMAEMRELLKWGDHKCGGSSAGVVELLECLEREAIMGEDEGREPLDYNRRALIFDKSGAVFQALKHQAEDDEDEVKAQCQE